jgi:hypothetical protein
LCFKQLIQELLGLVCEDKNWFAVCMEF